MHKFDPARIEFLYITTYAPFTSVFDSATGKTNGSTTGSIATYAEAV